MKIVKMSEMKPWELGRIIGNCGASLKGHIVMRTSSLNKPEIIDLTEPGMDNCWESIYVDMDPSDVEILPENPVLDFIKNELPKKLKKYDLKLDDPVLVSHDSITWIKRHFKAFVNDLPECWNDGLTSWSTRRGVAAIWDYWKLPEDEE